MEEATLQGISPVFVGWHDCGQVLHTHRSQSYGRRVVRHYEIEHIVFSHSGYVLTDGLPLQTIPHTVFVRRPGMEAEGVGVYRSVFVEFDPDEAARRLAVLDGLPPVIFQTEEPTFGEDFFQSLALPPRPEPWQLLAWKSRMLWLLAGLLRQAAAGAGTAPGTMRRSGRRWHTSTAITGNPLPWNSWPRRRGTAAGISASCSKRSPG